MFIYNQSVKNYIQRILKFKLRRISMEIKANISSLEDILADNRKFYQIPDYQRPYSWDKENLSDLIDDLFNAYTNNKNENYFCGSLVLVNNEKIKGLIL